MVEINKSPEPKEEAAGGGEAVLKEKAEELEKAEE